MPDHARRFSVVIPTLQRSPFLPRLLETLEATPEVAEVLVINNASQPLQTTLKKVRVLDQGQNIFVNPAWNLGVAEAAFDLVCLCNDDVILSPRIFRVAEKRLRRGAGIVGASMLSIRRPDQQIWSVGPWTLPTYMRPIGFGVFMCLDRANYVDIPNDLLIFWGDDYLFRRQERPNYALLGPCIATVMSTTSSAPEFASTKDADVLSAAHRYPEDPYRLRYWRRYRLQRMLAAALTATIDFTRRRTVGKGGLNDA